MLCGIRLQLGVVGAALLVLVLGLRSGSTRAQDRPPVESAPQTVPAAVTGTAPAPAPTPARNALPVPATAPSSQVAVQPVPPPSIPRRFQFRIDAKTPLKDLLPTSPGDSGRAEPVVSDDLARAPEIQFQEPLARDLPPEKALEKTAHTIAKINHVNAKKKDAFMEALRSERRDLAGLPFTLGDACRTKGERNRHFAQAVATVRAALGSPGNPQRVFVETAVPVVTAPSSGSAAPPRDAVTSQVLRAERVVRNHPHDEGFWERYVSATSEEDNQGRFALGLSRVNRVQKEDVTLARIAALMQILAPEPRATRLGLVKYVSAVAHVEATRALARLALFSAEDEVRLAAIDALKVRRERDYTEIFLGGLRYPWPAVARRAADAIVRLERTDLLPQLVDVLDSPDPRAPVSREGESGKVTQIRELVRINHHRNCLLCHAPANTGSVAPETLTAAVPVPSEPLPSPSEGYQTNSPDVLVRIDVTYLRQDFSAFHPVTDANPWPEMQRFDYLVRTRDLGAEETAAYQAAFARNEPNRPNPYQRAALAALRELTGKDAEPSAEAWRRLLKLQRPTVQRTAMRD